MTWIDDMRVDLPPGRLGEAEITRVEVRTESQNELGPVFPGQYTALMRSGTIWMTDTTGEMLSHLPAYEMARDLGGRCLVNGLGLGMIVKAMLLLPSVEHVDVVEIDADVIALVEPTLEQRFGDRLTVRHADAFEWEWSLGTRWTVIWHDIWPDLSERNLPEMARIRNLYQDRADWQGCWSEDTLNARCRSDPTGVPPRREGDDAR